MSELDWERVRQGKDAYRDRMAALPFHEKMRLLDRLRERTAAIAGPFPPANGNERTSKAIVHVSSGRQPAAEAGLTFGVINLGVFGAPLVAAMQLGQTGTIVSTVTPDERTGTAT